MYSRSVIVLEKLGNEAGVFLALASLAAAQLDLGRYEEAEGSFLVLLNCAWSPCPRIT